MSQETTNKAGGVSFIGLLGLHSRATLLRPGPVPALFWWAG